MRRIGACLAVCLLAGLVVAVEPPEPPPGPSAASKLTNAESVRRKLGLYSNYPSVPAIGTVKVAVLDSGFDRYGNPGPTSPNAPAPLLIDPGSYLLDWCCFLFQSEPLALRGCEAAILPGAEETGKSAEPEPDFESFTAEFAGGGLAQISFGRYHRGAWGEATKFLPPPGFQVYAERGLAKARDVMREIG